MKILDEFRKFKRTYDFNQKEIKEIDGKQYCEGYPLMNDEGEMIGECEAWINVLDTRTKIPMQKYYLIYFPMNLILEKKS